MSGSSISLRQARPRVRLPLTPLIDVVFILLVFFMLVSQFTDWRQIDLRPEASLGAGGADTKPLIIDLYPDDTIRVANQLVRDAAGAAMSAKERAQDGRPVIVHARTGVEIQPVIDLVEALTQAQIENVRVDAPAAEAGK